MRTFVGVLALFGVVLCLLVGGGYLYLSGQIPDVIMQGTQDFVIRADAQTDAETVRPELETAAVRFAELFGNSPSFNVALLDGPKQLNAASILLAVRREMGTPLPKLSLPFPTPRFASMIAAQDTAARANYRDALARRQPDMTESQLDSAVADRFDNIELATTAQRSIDHEAAHWMLAIYMEERARGNQAATLPTWLVEGIAGYCEAPERRLTALGKLKAALRASRLMNLDSLTQIAGADYLKSTETRQHEIGIPSGAEENQSGLFYAECTALVAYLEQEEPGIIKKMTDAAVDSGNGPTLSATGDEAFFEWIRTAESL